jgi:AsmA protein
MGKILKWVGIIIGILVVLIIVLLLVVPRFVDINKYKPKIESMVTESTGRPFSIGGEIDLTLFPWAGVSVSDVHLGNAKGFKEKDFASVEHFEVRVKLLPLIFRDVQVKRLVVKSPRIALEKDKAGRGNWEDLVKHREKGKPEPEPAPEEGPAMRIKNLMVGEFAITSGELLWIDHQKGTERRLTEVTLGVDPISMQDPIGFELSAQLDGQPMSVNGEVGPLPMSLGEGKVPVRLLVRALDTLVAKLEGFVADLGGQTKFTMALEVEPFSPQMLSKKLGVDLAERFRDPGAVTEMSLKTTLSGTSTAVSLKNGVLNLDDSTLTFDLKASEFERPVVSFDLKLDQIDMDRYMPPQAEAKEKEGTGKAADEKEKADYTRLRKLVMDGMVYVGRLKIRGATLSDVNLTMKAKNGVMRLDPFSMNLYGGGLSGNVILDVRKDTPRIQTAHRLEKVQAGPLLKDLGYTDRLEGVLNFTGDFALRGTEPERIKQTLNGSGEFAFTDGAIVGFDIAQMVRNVGSALGLSEKQKARTEFSEFTGNFTITNGLIDNPVAYLGSPLVRVTGKGKVDLPKETINYRIEPKFVGTLEGQGDTGLRSGLMVPIVISGTFDEPKFRPDLSGLAESGELKEAAKKVLESLVEEDEEKGDIAKEAEKLLEGLTEKKEGEKSAVEELLQGLFSSD